MFVLGFILQLSLTLLFVLGFFILGVGFFLQALLLLFLLDLPLFLELGL